MINVKGVIGVPVAMAKILFETLWAVQVSPAKFKTVTSSLRHSQLQVHIYIILKVVIDSL